MVIIWRTSDPGFKWNWYLQSKCGAKNQRTSKIKQRSLLQIESVSWHHSQFHNWLSFVEKPLFDGVNDLRRWREIGDWGKKNCKIDRKDHLEKIAAEKRRLLKNAIIMRENTAVAGAKWMENAKKGRKWRQMLLRRTRGKMGTEGKRGKRVRRDEGRKEDDVTKDTSEQFANGVARANWKGCVGRIMKDTIKTGKDFWEKNRMMWHKVWQARALMMKSSFCDEATGDMLNPNLVKEVEAEKLRRSWKMQEHDVENKQPCRI